MVDRRYGRLFGKGCSSCDSRAVTLRDRSKIWRGRGASGVYRGFEGCASPGVPMCPLDSAHNCLGFDATATDNPLNEYAIIHPQRFSSADPSPILCAIFPKSTTT